jgi:hypothetical protein
MRKGLWLAGLVLGLCAARPAAAQSAVSWGPQVGSIQNRVISTDTSQVPIAQPMTRSFGFRLANLFPNVTRMAAKPDTATTIFPTPSQLPGKDYFSVFGMHRPQPISP